MKKLISYILSFKMRTKITLSIFLIILIFSFGVVVVIKDSVYKNINLIAHNSIENLIRVNETNVLKYLLEGDYWSIFKFVSSIKKIDMVKSATFLDKEYNVVASSNPQNFPIDFKYTLKYTKDEILVPLQVKNNTFGYFVVKIQTNLLNILINDIKSKLIFSIIAAALVSFLIGYLMSVRIVGRLEMLSFNAKMIQNKKWEKIKQEDSLEKDEIYELSNIINMMLDKIQEMISSEENLKTFYYSILENLDELVIICDFKLNIKYKNSNRLQNILLKGERFNPKISQFLQNKILQNESSFVLEVENENKKLLYLHVNTKKIKDELVFSFLNITSLKRFEEKQHFKNSFEIVGEISSEVVHEIKNHLQPIKLLLEQENIDNEDRQRVISIISKIDVMVKNFLKSGKPIDKKLSIFININDFIEEMLFLFANDLKNKHIKLEKNVAKNVNVYIAEVDLHTILTNLLKNAIEASQDGEKIVIECFEEAENVVFKITNGGNIIDKDILKNIHKPFFTTKEGGSGIGLYAVYKIVYLYGGFVNVQTYNDKITFDINLPKG